MKKVVLLMLCVLVSLTVCAQKKSFGNGLFWEVTDDGTLIISGQGDIPDFPEKKNYENKSVAPWDTDADKGKIKRIVIEEGIRRIGNGAFNFYYWDKNGRGELRSSVTEVSLPSTLTHIGDWAFRNSWDLEKIHFPEGLEAIGANAFDSSGLKELEFPNSLLYIGSSAFFLSRSLRSVKFGKNLKRIGNFAFSACYSLREVVWPENLLEIGKYAFNLTELKEIVIPAKVHTIGTKAFYGLDSLQAICFTGDNVTKMGEDAFSHSEGGGEPGEVINVPYNGLIVDPPAIINKGNCETYGISKEAYDNRSNIFRNARGQIILPAKYGRQVTKYANFCRVKENGKFGCMNMNGEWILPLVQDAVEPVGSYIKYKKVNSWGVADLNGKIIIPDSRGYRSIGWENGYYKFSKDGNKYGIANTNGVEIIAPQYTDIKKESGGFVVKQGNAVGLLSLDGKQIIPAARGYSGYKPLTNQKGKQFYIVYGNGHTCGIVNANGREILPPEYDEIDLLDDYIKFRINDFWGIANMNGKTIIPTSRGYTSIDRYIASQRVFTYTKANGKGECSVTGKQLSFIETPQQHTPSSDNQSTTPTSVDNGQQHRDKPERIIIEHHRDPVPVQVWVSCGACYGDGRCGTCAGTGRGPGSGGRCISCGYSGKCRFCNGQGGRYQVQYQ